MQLYDLDEEIISLISSYLGPLSKIRFSHTCKKYYAKFYNAGNILESVIQLNKICYNYTFMHNKSITSIRNACKDDVINIYYSDIYSHDIGIKLKNNIVINIFMAPSISIKCNGISIKSTHIESFECPSFLFSYIKKKNNMKKMRIYINDATFIDERQETPYKDYLIHCNGDKMISEVLEKINNAFNILNKLDPVINKYLEDCELPYSLPLRFIA